MTPLHLEIALHYHVSCNEHPRRGAPAVEDYIKELVAAEILWLRPKSERHSDWGEYSTTEKGQAWIDMLLATPYPTLQTVTTWVDPRKIGMRV